MVSIVAIREARIAVFPDTKFLAKYEETLLFKAIAFPT